MKKFILITVVLCFSGNVFAYSGGDGSAGNPYQISSVADWQMLTNDPNNWNKSFILMADIDLAGESFTRAPIAPDTDSVASDFQGTKFTGSFDGNGRTIRNAIINQPQSDCVGLFGVINSTGQVKNLGVKNISVNGRWGVGGLVGYNAGNITSCYFAGSVSGSMEVGGLVGANDSNGIIASCYSIGSVSGSWEVGGLAGSNTSHITSSYSATSVSGPPSSCVGSFIGNNDFPSAVIISCFWDTQTSGTSVGVGAGSAVGVTGKTTLEMKTKATFSLAGWDFNTPVWKMGTDGTGYPQLAWESSIAPRPSMDFNGDCIVDLADFAMFVDQWLDEGTSTANYSLKNDFSTTQNPNGVWSYNLAGSPITQPVGGSLVVGWGYWPSFDGSIVKAIEGCTSLPDIQFGEIMIHACSYGSDNSVTWTSPAAGTIAISGQAWGGGYWISSGRDASWQLTVDSIKIAERATICNTLRADAGADFINNLTSGSTLSGIGVAAGDVVEFKNHALGTGYFMGVNLDIALTTGTTCPSMDFNGDCKVDFADYAMFAAQWMGVETQTGDWQLYSTVSTFEDANLPNTLMSVNHQTGEQVQIGGPGATPWQQALDTDPVSGFLFGINYTNPGVIITRIDPHTGQCSQAATLQQDISALAFSPTGTLYGISGQKTLGIINLGTNTFSPVAQLDILGSVLGMDFSPQGSLYVVDDASDPNGSGSQRLRVVNASTGTITSTIALGVLYVGDIDFAPDGYIYHTNASYALFKLDPSTGAQTLVGFGNMGPLGGIASATGSDTGSSTLTVNSSGVSGVDISSSTGHNGTTNYTKTLTAGTSVTLTAPATAGSKVFSGWTGDINDSNQTISFSMDGNKTVTASYNGTIPTGSLSVTISPADAVSAGAQWRRIGTATWYNSGDTETSIATGSYTVEFKDITGWTSPANQDVTISDGGKTNASGTYCQTGIAVLNPTSSFRILTWYPNSHDPGYLAVYNVGDNVQHTILQFDFGSIPHGAEINSATLTLVTTGWTQPAGTHSDVYAIATPWDSSATWLQAAATIPWLTPGGDVTGAAYATNSDVIAGEGVPVNWDVTSLVRDWQSAALPNYGILLTGTPGNQLHFQVTSPQLSVNYRVCPGSDPVLSTVPNVVGMTQAAATTAITGASLTVGTVTQQYDNTIAAGSVISQSPVSGTSVNAGSAVNLVVSLGVAPVLPGAATNPVPADGSINAAISADLSWTAGAGATSYNVYFGTELPGTPQHNVDTTTFDPNTLANNTTYYWRVDAVNGSGTTTGPIWSFTTAAASVSVPNVVGLMQAEATTAITNASLTVGTVTQQYDNTVTAGLVISQSPVSGTSVNSGSAVNLVVSFGSQISDPNEMVVIPGGTFQMGDSFMEGESCELPVHTVTLSPFYMGKYEITNAQYKNFLNSAYSQGLITVTSNVVYQAGSGTSYPYCNTRQSSAYSQINWDGSTFTVCTKSGRDMSNDPVVLVTWYGAVAYCNWISQQTGKPQCYNLSTWAYDPSINGYHLPTEAQWEYAARGGLSGNRFPWGNTISQTQANFYSDNFPYDISPTKNQNHPLWSDGDNYPYTSPVGFFDGTLKSKGVYNWPGSATSYQTTSGANNYGLHDMADNVFEWCHDWYGNYSSALQVNPTGYGTGTSRVLRGGCYGGPASYSRVAFRINHAPTLLSEAFGFRMCRDGAPVLSVVPNVVGMTQAAAETAITNISLTVGTVTQQYDNTVAAGLVISQDPAGGTTVNTGSAVNLVVSLGTQVVPYTYTTDNGTVTITGYTGSGGAITIPSTINGLPVTSIGNWAFQNCTNLTSVTIPSSVTSIGNGAFAGCYLLPAIMVDMQNARYSSVDGVLFSKDMTTLVEYPAGKIGTTYTIPNSVINIGDDAFFACYSLTSVTIPNSVTSIGSQAFSGTGLTNITIGNSVTSIGYMAFSSCGSLTSVAIGSGVAYIGNGAFAYCNNLTAITVDSQNANYSSADGVLFNKSQTTLRAYPPGRTGTYTIPASVTSIGYGVFWYCTNLTSVTIPNSVTSIESDAFFGCNNLMSVYFQGNAPSLGSGVFEGDDNATVYYLAGTTGWGVTFGGRPTAVYTTIPSQCTLPNSDFEMGNFSYWTITGDAWIDVDVPAAFWGYSAAWGYSAVLYGGTGQTSLGRTISCQGANGYTVSFDYIGGPYGGGSSYVLLNGQQYPLICDDQVHTFTQQINNVNSFTLQIIVSDGDFYVAVDNCSVSY